MHRRGAGKLLTELVDGVLVLKAIDRKSLKEYVLDLVTLADGWTGSATYR